MALSVFSISHALVILISVVYLSSVTTVSNAQDDSIPPYSINDHPFYTLPQFSSFSITPRVVKKYHRNHVERGKIDVRQTIFAPHIASYNHFSTGETFCSNVDVLVASNPNVGEDPEGSNSYFLHFELNHAARVFVVVSGKGTNKKLMKAITADPGSVDISGVPADWSAPSAIENVMSNRQLLSGVNRDNPRFNPTLAKFGVAFEISTPQDLKAWLPNPKSITINGVPMQRYYVLFVQPDSLELKAFPSAAVPPPFESPLTKTVIDPSNDVPKANDKCPEWLHDIYIVRSRTGGEDLGEPSYWRTWHPIIDPIYWCFFTHEHGSYPGPSYRPQFGYTAWKTPDSSTSHGRQEESHNGFKTIAFVVPNDGRSVVITVHMHASKARRFKARRHTMIFAVIDAQGSIQAEVSMKMDFGAALVSLATKKTVPIDDEQKAIDNELKKLKIGANRRFNLINIDENYPTSVDLSYRIRDVPLPADPSKVRGFYEKWRGRLNSCVSSTGRSSGLRIDIQNPATAMRFTSGDELSWLAGNSMVRVLSTKSFEFGVEHCSFEEGTYDESQSDGYFYTDSYFSKVENDRGSASVKQFIMSGFQKVTFPTGKVVLTDFWSGYNSYDTSRMVRPVNFDGAIKKEEN